MGIEIQRSWRDASRLVPSSRLRSAAAEFRSTVWADANRAGTTVLERYARVLALDGLVTRELARRRDRLREDRRGRRALDRAADTLSHLVTLSPTQRIADYRDGTHRLEVAPYPALDYTDAVTYTMWLRLDGNVTVDDSKIVSHAGVVTGKLAVMLDRDNRFIVAVHQEAPARLGWRPPLPLGVWIHVALTFERGRGFVLYVDGDPADPSGTVPSRISRLGIRSDPGQALYIGGPDRAVPGSLDDLRIYDRALSTAEVRRLVAGEPVDRGLIGHWPLDDIRNGITRNAVSGGTDARVGRGVTVDPDGAHAPDGGRAVRFARRPGDWIDRLRTLQSELDGIELDRLAGADDDRTFHTLHELLEHLSRREVALLHYAEDPSGARALAFVVNPHSEEPVDIVDLGPTTALREESDRVRRLLRWSVDLREEDERIYRSAARRLAQRIWDPVEPRIEGIDEIWIRPGASLHGVPFSALVDRSGRYLYRRHAFARTGPVPGLPRPRRFGPGRTVVAFGDPAFGAYPGDGGLVSEGGPVVRGAGTNECLLPGARLFGTGTELDRLRDVFEDRPGHEIRVYRGDQALESRLRRAVRQADVVHIATHAYRLEPRCLPEPPWNPLLRTGLQLAGTARPRPESDRSWDDGYLSADELSRLPLLATSLVLFSGCSTATGPVWPEEGVLGLGAAAWIAGAGASFATLWEVDDQTMADDVLVFYEGWLGGQSPALALRTMLEAAHARTVSESGHGHPALWAAPVIEGL